MPDKAQSLLLTDLIAVGYLPSFLSDPVGTANGALPQGFKLVAVIYGTDFKDLFGQETVPYGMIAEDAAGVPYVALRGTDSAKEWLEDGFAVPEPWPFSQSLGVRTHKGFTDLFETLATMDGKSILGALAGRRPIVTGHSLGAALAALLGAALGPSCASCVTFEGPRVGNEDFCRWSDSRLPGFFRYVIMGDVVPHAPPELLGYYHAGTEVELDPAGIIAASADPLTHATNLHVLSSVQAVLESM